MGIPAASGLLGRDDREALLRIARESIAARLRHTPPPGERRSEALERPAGAFVTLTIDGDLRGCIGTLDASRPLHRAVSESAVSAAMRDPRFPPLTPGELESVRLEISVLGDFVPVLDPTDIVIGRDGLMIRAGGRSGLLLPQVPVEHGWDVMTFLERLCVKAGLPPGSWRRSDCMLERFPAEVFGE
ncbi:MAG: AmmeMemoRadiSam system protein A [Acidobacteria bacterium]|nr:AmmeMemoRadiSam system protein A [Acidobacteriota bacterium]